MQYFDKVVYTFSADNEPTGTIDSGEIVIFRTQDCFSNQMHSESQLVTSCDYSKMNPATGPLFVRDAQPGDVIKVELLDVQCDTIGTTTLPKIGPLWDKCETRTKRIPIENGKAVFNDVTFPINPMIGVIGVAPEKGKSVPCRLPRQPRRQPGLQADGQGQHRLLPRARGRWSGADGRHACRHG